MQIRQNINLFLAILQIMMREWNQIKSGKRMCRREAYLKYSASLGNALNAEREKEKATESTKCRHSACFAQGEELTDINV